jgi:MFS family permease
MFDNVTDTLKSRNFRLFFGGQSISLIGTWLQQVAMGWLVWRLSHSAFTVGMVGFFTRLPTFLLAPYAGVVADRTSRYKLLVLTQALSLVQAAALAALVLSGVVQVWHLAALGLCLGLINAFDVPVRQSFMIEMIDRKEDLGTAIAINSSMNTLGRMLGPALAGLLVALIGEGWCFSLNALSFVAILGSLAAMTVTPRLPSQAPAGRMDEFRSGARYAFGFPPIRDILLLLAVSSLMGMPFQVLLPVFAGDTFKGGANTLGFLTSATGVGAMLSTVYLMSRRNVLGLLTRLTLGAGLFGLGLIGFAFAANLWEACVLAAVAGMGMMVQIAGSNTLIQTIVEDDLRGRVMSFYTMAFMGTVPFGNLLSGILADRIGARHTVLLGGACCLIAAGLFALRMPSIRGLIRPIYVRKGILPAPDSAS